MTLPDRLLYPVFDALRERGVPLGISEYAAAVEAVRAGFHLESPERLCRLLCLLWAKSRDDLALVASEFREKVAPWLSVFPKAGGDPTGETTPSRHFDEEAAQALVLEQKAWKTTGESGPAGARRLTAPERPIMERPRFLMTPRPSLNARDAARAFRRYCRPLRFGLSDRIDVDATVAKICRQRYLVRPDFEPLKINRAELLLLVDRGGSMTPFSLGVGPLINAVRRESGIRRPRIYYFHDCPETYLFQTPGLADPIRAEEALAMPAAGLGILIVSDAGAARGDFDGRRAVRTEAFLDRLKKLTPRVAWLNPVPSSRWNLSTAGDISRLAPMFPLTREGLEDAVKVLRGHPMPGAGPHGY
jgi:uncharacterized protein with von Willebrand factor type A (vWA) domain